MTYGKTLGEQFLEAAYRQSVRDLWCYRLKIAAFISIMIFLVIIDTAIVFLVPLLMYFGVAMVVQ